MKPDFEAEPVVRVYSPHGDERWTLEADPDAADPFDASAYYHISYEYYNKKENRWESTAVSPAFPLRVLQLMTYRMNHFIHGGVERVDLNEQS